MEQRSQEWFQARLGKVTASRLSNVLAKGRGGGPSAVRRNYMAELIAEKLTGNAPEGFSNAAIQWGIDTEPMAREAYGCSPIQQLLMLALCLICRLPTPEQAQTA